jgi:hypothetical protein
MAARIGLIIAAIAGTAALGTAGYFANEWRVCTGLEEDYLNSVSSLKGNIAMKSFMQDPDGIKAIENVDAIEMRRIEQTLASLHQQCGKRSANSAVRKGQELLLGS